MVAGGRDSAPPERQVQKRLVIPKGMTARTRCDPVGIGANLPSHTGGVAALNRRLPAVIPLG